jgi:predicted nucleic acid-binding protein
MVLDTNVVLSALVFGGGLAGQARRAWQDGLLVPLASRATVQKLVRVVEQGELLVDFLSCAATVRIPQPPPQVPRCRDAFDEPFMHLAVAGFFQACARHCAASRPIAACALVERGTGRCRWWG